MLLFPNCKINLGLRIVRKREDGYHDLETIFYPVYGLHDELEVEPAEEFAFLQDGLVVDCLPTDNLIYKVYKRMQEHFPQIGNVKITFKKNIPFGAGLGGGSSDAAHMAIALNEIFALGLTREQLAEEVRPLGADCPFFIYNTPCYAEGIGDQLTPISLDLSGLRLVMIKPACGVSTKEAYAGIKPKGTCKVLNDLKVLTALNNLTILSALTNDFEETVCKVHPEIAEIKQRLLDAGALYAAMSGSGSTVFGLFQNNAEGRTDAQLRLLHEEFASMVIFDDTLA
ncbi:MAG: 4-(cytidine 5'-diphospho)-2-C-methyl-D-erythritol kinase [Paludibacteraceae bacterium]|nr:4-(cytidine 5'-diphospho)-2-C-methyl-D-erythritol kinase [Paludibacteraceae bacterium]